MKILLIVKQKKNFETFRSVVGSLLARGHAVTVAIQEREDENDERLGVEFDRTAFRVIRCPRARTDEWSGTAALLRSLRDCVQYLRPQLRDAVKLQTRTVLKLTQELTLPAEAATVATELRSIPAAQVNRIEAVLKLAERSLPTDPLYDELIGSDRPDFVLISPLVHFGPAQADVVASARQLGLPVGMLLFSWDNLSTKGCLHRWPDWLFVWNEQQRREAMTLHSFPPDRVVVIGAPRFDAFFELRSEISRDAFHRPLGLDPSKPTLLYVCSSRFVSESELPFIRRWLAAIRNSTDARLRECNVMIRPHPDVSLLPADEPVERVRWPQLRSLRGSVARPFDDSRAVVLRTANRSPQGLFESMAHSVAVIGLNTSAELEAGIVGRPVLTVVAGESEANGQHTTLHFHYLLKKHGGFVSMGASLQEHVAQLESTLTTPPDTAQIRAFIERFLRPHGIDQPVAPLLAQAIERVMTGPSAVQESPVNSEKDDIQPDAPQSAGADVVRLAKKTIQIDVYRTPEITRLLRTSGFAFNKEVVDWLTGSVDIGDVVYDVAAGVGVYTLIAAKHRGALVVAFESGFAAFGRLCENLRLNACDGRVIPVPLELSDRDGLKELKYERWRAGEDTHTLRENDWHMRPTSGEHRYVQPVLVTPLDAAIARYRLPAPNHLRLSSTLATRAVLGGSSATLVAPSLKSIFVTVAMKDVDAVIAHLTSVGWEDSGPSAGPGDTCHLRFRREPVSATSAELRRTAG